MTRLSRCPPPVQYPLQRSAVLGTALGGLLSASAAVLAAWVWLGAGASWRAALAAAGLWLLALLAAVHFWRGQFSGTMRWDGQAWTLQDPGPGAARSMSWPLSGPPEVLLDLQTQLWVRVSPLGYGRIRHLWLWLGRSSQPERWLDLRRAVYSRAKPDAGAAGDADATTPASSHGA